MRKIFLIVLSLLLCFTSFSINVRQEVKADDHEHVIANLPFDDGIADDVEWIAWTSDNSLPSTTSDSSRSYYNKYYYLTKDVYLTAAQTIDRTVAIDLNGYSVYKAPSATFTGAMITVSGIWANPLIITNSRATVDTNGLLTSTAGFHGSNATGTEAAVLTASGNADKNEYPNVKLYGIDISNNSNLRTANDEWMPGGIFWRSKQTLTIDTCSFKNNISGSTLDDTSTYGSGGAITIKEPGTVNINNTIFDGNKAGLRGSAILIPAGVGATLNINNSIFANNVVYYNNSGNSNSVGGTICVHDGTTNISNTSFTSNTNAGLHGTAISMLRGSVVTLNNTTITNNTNTNEYTTYKGAVVLVDSSAYTPTLTISGDTVISGNTNSASKQANLFLRDEGHTPKINVSSLGSSANIGVDAKATISATSTYTLVSGSDVSGKLFADNSNYGVYYYGGNTILGLKPTSIDITEDSLDVTVGNTGTLHTTLAPEYASATIVWSTGDSGIATVDNGTVTGVGDGNTTITATIQGTTISDTCPVTVKEYKTVTFMNGTSVFASEQVLKGQTVAEPATMPEQSGFAFVEWQLNGVAYDFTQAVNDDLTLDAYFDASAYQVILNTNGGTINSGNVTSYTHGTETTLPTDVTKDNYEFGGWYLNSSCTGDRVYVIAASEVGAKTYYAKWTPNQYTVIFDANGGQCDTVSKLVTYGEAYGTLPGASKEKHSFSGWKLSTDLDGEFITATSIVSIDGDATLVAIYNIDTYPVVYKDVGGGDFSGNHVGSYPTIYAVDTDYDLDSPEKPGSNFLGYYLNQSGTGQPITILLADSYSDTITLFAKWEVATYDITYETNGGTINEAYDTTYQYGNVITLPTDVTRDDFTFGGWYDNAELTGSAITQISASEYGNKAFYAKWNGSHNHTGCHDGVPDGVEWIPWTSNNSLPSTTSDPSRSYYDKYYYLTCDVYLTSKQVIERTVTICLNGYSIYRAPNAAFSGALIGVAGKWVNPFILTNCKATFDSDGFLSSTAGVKNGSSTGTEAGALTGSGSGIEFPNVTLYGINFENNAVIRTANDEWMPGAIFWRSQNTLTIHSCAFKNNTSGSALDETSTYGAGGAITIKEPGTVNITNTVFDGNKAGLRGGAILIPSGVNATLNIEDSKFVNNKIVYSEASNAGILALNAGTTSITNTSFTNNTNAGGNGTVITAQGSANVTLEDVSMTNNTNTNEHTAYRAAISSINTPTITIKGNTVISGNTTSDGKEANIYLRRGSGTYSPKLILTNLDASASLGVNTNVEINATTPYVVAEGIDASDNVFADYEEYETYYYNSNTVLGLKPTITLDADSASMDIGDSVQITATVSPTYAEDLLTWTSDDTGIATVSPAGLIVGVSAGGTTVHATVKNTTKDVQVTVTPGKSVKFETNGGTVIPEQFVLSGQTATRPDPDPTKEGFTFVNWYKDGAEYDFSTPVTEPMVLVAKWKANESGIGGVDVFEDIIDDVTIDNDVNSLATNANAVLNKIKDGETVEEIVIDDTQIGKIQSAANLNTTIEIEVKKDTLDATQEAALNQVLSASFLRDIFDISIKLTIENTDTAEKIVDEQKVYSLPTKMLFTVKSSLINDQAIVIKVFGIHKDALGNTTVEEINIESVDRTNGTVSFYADRFSDYVIAAGSKMKVSFETNGGSTIAPVEVEYNNPVEKPANPTKLDTSFAGWFSDAALTNVFDFATPITGDITLYANWHQHHGIGDGADNVEWIPWDRTDSLPCYTSLGNQDAYYNKHFYLLNDVYISTPQVFHRTVTICLNGHSIYRDPNSTLNTHMIEVNGKWANPVIFTDCKATFDGDGHLTSHDGIKNGVSTNTTGGAIYLRDAALKLFNIEMSNNSCTNDNVYNWQGGAILNRGGLLDIYNCTFTNNRAGNVDNVEVKNGAGGAIAVKGGTAGLITADGVPVINITNTVFTGNKAAYRGGAISSDVVSVINLKDCIFSNNSVTAKQAIGGAALYLNGGSDSTIDNCTFTGNYNNGMRGSAMTIESDTTKVALKDCTFTNNRNQTNAKRAAIVIQNAEKVSIEGRMTFSGNYNGKVESDILLRKDGFKLSVKQLTNGSKLYIDTDEDYVGPTHIDEFGDKVREIEDPDYFLQKEGDYTSWTKEWMQYQKTDLFIYYDMDGSKKFEFFIDRSHVHCVCGHKEGECPEGHDMIPYQPWTKNNALPEKPGNYVLMCDVTLPDGIDISNKTNIKICLNGHTIKQTKDKMWVYRLSKDSTLTISDCTATGEAENYKAGIITGCEAGAIVLRDDTIRNLAKRGTKFEFYGGIFKNNHNVKSGGQIQQYGHSVFNMYGGLITGGYTEYSGGAVAVEAKSECNIYGGYFIKNKAKYNGGAICAKDGKLNIYGGLFKNNLTSFEDTKSNSLGGAIHVYNNSEFNLAGGTITNNNAYKGGGVFCLRSKVKVSGGTISYNTSKENGGGIFVATKCEFDITGGVVSHNKGQIGAGYGFYDASGTIRNVVIDSNESTTRAGGMYITRDSDIRMYNCSIRNNKTDLYGGGIYMDRGSKIYVSGTTFKNNEAKSSGAMMLNNAGVEATFNNAKFVGNKATEGDGGALSAMNHSVITIKSGEFTDNTATNSGGAVFIRKAYLVVEDIDVHDNSAVVSGGGLEIEGIDVSIKKPILDMSGGHVYNNNAPRGGGIYVTKGNATFTGGLIEGNEAYEGAGIYSRNVGYIDATNLEIKDNEANETGGGLYLARGTRSFLNNVTISGNKAKTAAGMYLDDDCQMTSMTIKENVASNGVGGLLIAPGSYDGESYNSSIIKMSGDMYIYENKGTISDLLISNGTTVGSTTEGLGKETKMLVNTDGNHITRVLVAPYNYEKIADDTYLVTYGTEYHIEPAKKDDAPDEEKEESGIDGKYIAIGGGVGAVAIIGAVIAANKKKKKKEEKVD